jgi:hypothetical protein
MPLQDLGHARAGVGYYGYSDIEGHTALAGNTAGNSFVGGVYAEDFGVAEVFAELEAKLADNLKGTVYGSYANNTQADGDLDSAYMVGAKLGTKIAGKKVSFKYDWRDIEADATIGALNDSDFGGGGTDARGHRFGASIKPTDRTEVAVTYLMNEVGIDDSAGKGSAEYDYDRVQFDLKFKF